jgi:hypothetical protein
MLVATIALVVALGGVSYAAGVLPKHSVGTAQLQKKAVTRAKLKRNAVTGAKVRDGSLQAADFGTGQLPQGPKGDSGPQGPKGDPGATARNSIGADQVKDGSLGPEEFAASIPAVHVTGPSNGSVPNTTHKALTLDIERYDTAGMHSPSANSSRLTAPVDGVYLVNAQVSWASGSGYRELSLRKNEGNPIAIAGEALTSTQALAQDVTTQVRLQAGDFVEAFVFQTSNAPLNVLKLDDYSPEFSMTWLAPGP